MNITRRIIPCFAALFLALVLGGCGNTPHTPMPDASTPVIITPKMTATPGLTASPKPTSTRKINTPRPTFDSTADALTNPPPTPIWISTIDATGNITWHPQKKLISWGSGGADGTSYQDQSLILFWDGTLLQEPDNPPDAPYITKLDPNEVCKVLNTVEASGFFEETGDYDFPFDGAASSFISVQAWKSNASGAQDLWGAIAGEPYYDKLFCRDCPIPSAKTIIRPGLANVYYFLQNYLPANRQKAPVDEIYVRLDPSEQKSNRAWPLTSLTLDQFIEKCALCDNMGFGMTIDGAAAQEIMRKIKSGEIFPRSFFTDYPSIEITYEAVWPEAPDVPPDATLTCNAKAGQYPILPLNPKNKFWYYAPGGKWGAERVEGQNKMRVVNTSGYEKFYQYDATFFGQASIQVYPRFWSADGQFFYVNILPGDYKPDVSFVNSIGLQQIDVKNEKIKYLFLGSEGQTFDYEFSNDGKKVAYIRQGDIPPSLVVVDTYSGEEKVVKLTTPEGIPYSSAGTLTWSPGDDKIFVAANYAENGQQKGHILVTHIDNLADIRIVYKADNPIELLSDFNDTFVHICGMQPADNNCRIDLNLNTEEVK